MNTIGAPPPPAGPPPPDRAPAAFPSPGGGALVWLVRHASVREDFHEVAYGNSDVPLSEVGRAETERVSAAFAGLPLARVQSSDLARAAALGRAIAAASGAPLVLDPRLREIDRGRWQGLAKDAFAARWRADAERFYADPYAWRGHGGESDDDVWARVAPALVEGLAAAAGRPLALTCHFNVLRVITIRCLGWPPSAGFAFRNGPARLTLLRADEGAWRLLAADAADPRDVLREAAAAASEG